MRATDSDRMTPSEPAVRRKAPTMTFVFPMPPNLANGRMHWRVKENARQCFNEQCDILLSMRQLPDPPPEPWRTATANVVMYLGSEMDDDNAGHRCKWIWDWLKTRGYIADDRKKNLKLASYPEQRIKRDKRYRVEVALTKLEVAA